MPEQPDTIAAIATPPGNGGIGIVRVSGPGVPDIANGLLKQMPVPRMAHYALFRDADDMAIDSGIVLYFPAPHSYTGEDTLELQGHGGTVVLDMLLQRVISLGARPAKPGEFTERAYLNGKLDLAQAEAVADLIDSSTEQSVRSAQKSIQGLFSRQINELLEQLIHLRTYVEAAIDFAEEEIDFLSDGVVETRLDKLAKRINHVLKTAGQGRLLRDGMTVVIAGKPNAGKSSLLNHLAGHEAAIVTELAGTTRDVLRERIQIDGMPLHVIDTAGIRQSTNVIEQEGIRRAQEEISKADRILLITDVNVNEELETLLEQFPADIPVTRIGNKIDLQAIVPAIVEQDEMTSIYLSVKTGAGLDLLRSHLKKCMGYQDSSENVFMARRRHIEALQQARGYIEAAQQQLSENMAGELVAEDLRLAQQHLGEITGEFSSDDLLGEIFSSFCIGK